MARHFLEAACAPFVDSLARTHPQAAKALASPVLRSKVAACAPSEHAVALLKQHATAMPGPATSAAAADIDAHLKK